MENTHFLTLLLFIFFSYRVKKLKGTASSEEALMVRLHLMQAIAAFTSGDTAKAKLLFQLSREELKKLRVPADALEEVMAQGFTKLESRLALRASQNNPTLAVKHAQDTRQKREEEDEAEHERNKKRRKLGKKSLHSALNLEKKCNFKNGKKSIFAPEKSLNLPKMQFSD